VTALAQTFDGEKTFLVSPIVPTPTTPTQASNKEYTDTKASKAFVIAMASAL